MKTVPIKSFKNKTLRYQRPKTIVRNTNQRTFNPRAKSLLVVKKKPNTYNSQRKNTININTFKSNKRASNFNYKPKRPNNFRRSNALMSNIKFNASYSRNYNKLSNYLFALLHPEVVCSRGLSIKQPSLFQVPSATISFKNTETYSPTSLGDFKLVWTPYFLCDSTATFLNYTDYCCEDVFSRHWHAQPTLNIALKSYRLVSARLDFTYVGNVVNQSGYVTGAAAFAYKKSVINMDGSAVLTPSMPTLDEVTNALWSKSKTLTTYNTKMSFLWLPIDPTDQVFYAINTYYGDDEKSTTEHYTTHTSNEGANLNYILYASGLPNSENCIRIEAYYVFEVIPTVDTAMFFKQMTRALPPNQYNHVMSVLANKRMQGATII